MNSVLGLTKTERIQLFNAAAQELGIDTVLIEKDFWVCWTLRQLFSLPDISDHLIFKGGTSLSKVWRAIERFSEDIDVSLSRAWLGFGDGNDPERAGSRKKRAQKLAELSATCATKIKNELLPLLAERARNDLGEDGWILTIAAEDPQTVLFQYPSVLPEAGMSYIPRTVKIEAGARSDDWPAEDKSILPHVAEAFAGRITDCEVTVKALSIERTFWEKATILHSEANRPADKATPQRFSRHYSDLAMLATIGAGQSAINRDDLRARVVAHKQVFFESAWASYETAVPGQFKLIPPPDRLAVLERDYRDMRQMFFREPLSWAEVITALRALEGAINNRAE